VASAWFDLFHASGNLLFALFFTRPVASMLIRFRERFSFLYHGDAEEAVTENEPMPGILEGGC
jgi:hypothetical protein